MIIILGACKVINITDEFDFSIRLIASDFGHNVKRITTIVEIDYLENKYSYEREQNSEEKEYDIADNPVVEILFYYDRVSSKTYRLGKPHNLILIVLATKII